MGQFNINDYETVQSRLPKFFEKYDGGRVITNLESDINDLSTVVFKAELWDGDKLLSTGWAFEKEGAGFVNKTAHVENCETSAIGRALANITIHGDKRPSREEMQKVQRNESRARTPKEEEEALTKEQPLNLDHVTIIQNEMKKRQGLDDITSLLAWCAKKWEYPINEVADIKQGDAEKFMKIIKKKPLKVN